MNCYHHEDGTLLPSSVSNSLSFLWQLFLFLLHHILQFVMTYNTYYHINGSGGYRLWQPVQTESQPKSSGLVLGRRPLGAVLHSSYELVNSRNGHDDSTINIVLELQLLLLPCLLSAFYSLDLYCSIFITYLCNNWKQNKFLLSYFCSFIFFYFCKLRPILRLATCYILFFTFVYVNCIIQNVCNLLLVVNKRLVRWMNWCYICVVMLCSYSHGETVGMDELQPFLEPDYRCSAHQLSIISLSLHTSCQSFLSLHTSCQSFLAVTLEYRHI